MRFFGIPFLSAIFLALTSGSFALADQFRDIRGTWTGTYKVAYPHGHPTYPDRAVETRMELEVYNQQDNLIWVINRWKREDSDTWITEYGTGSFDLDDRSDLIIAEKGPAPDDSANTGSFFGELEDGKLYLNYTSPGHGITFSVELSRRPD